MVGPVAVDDPNDGVEDGQGLQGRTSMQVLMSVATGARHPRLGFGEVKLKIRVQSAGARPLANTKFQNE